MRYLYLVVASLCVAPVWLWASASYDILAVKKELTVESKQQGRMVIVDENQRNRIVHHFAKKLMKFDDLGLGDVQGEKNKQDLDALKQKLEVLLQTYKEEVRPILLNNIVLKRKDIGEKMNKVELSKLVFPTKYNHKMRKPIGGIFHYKQDIDDSFFGEQWVDAGLLVNFPEIVDEQWVKEALQMDAELIAFWRIHLAYMDGISTAKIKTAKKSAVAVTPAQVKTQMNDWPAYKREKVVRKFVRKMQKLDDDKAWDAFKLDLMALLETYEYTVKPILVDNVNQRRPDMGARANRGDLIGLFYPHKRNYKTGKPISSKLNHRGSSQQKLGYAIRQPELMQNAVVKRALVMEEELETLLEEHKSYMKYDRSVMY